MQGPYIFPLTEFEFSLEVILIVAAAGCGQVGRCSCSGQREALTRCSSGRAPASRVMLLNDNVGRYKSARRSAKSHPATLPL